MSAPAPPRPVGEEAASGDAMDAGDLWRMVQDAAASAGVGILVTVDDPEAGPRFAYANDVMRALTGYSLEEFRALPSLALVPPEDLPEMAARRERRLAGEPEPARFETRLLAKDGRRVPVEAGLGRSTWNGRPATVIFLRDLAAVRAVETRLVNLETIYNATPDGFLFVDREMRLVSANRRFAELFGFSLEDVLSLPPDVVRARARARYRDPASFDRSLGAYSRERQAEAFDEEFELDVDPPRILHEHSEPIFDASGAFVGRVWTYRDVTRERELARELARHAETLEQEVARRTATLVQSAKLAALGQLVAGVAHEINNPLATVTSDTAVVRDAVREVLAHPDVQAVVAGDASRGPAALAWLQEEGHLKFFGHDAPELLERNRRGLARIRAIVQHLRAFAAPLPAAKAPADLNKVVEETLSIFGAQFGDRVETAARLAALPPVPCDAGKVGQVLTNLLVNAAQAVAARGRVEVETRLIGGRAVVRVTDDGPGIPPGLEGRVFDPFFTTKGSGNLGLGLSISHGIVREHGGEMGVESRPGCTTFWFALPLGSGEGR